LIIIALNLLSSLKQKKLVSGETSFRIGIEKGYLVLAERHLYCS